VRDRALDIERRGRKALLKPVAAWNDAELHMLATAWARVDGGLHPRLMAARGVDRLAGAMRPRRRMPSAATRMCDMRLAAPPACGRPDRLGAQRMLMCHRTEQREALIVGVRGLDRLAIVDRFRLGRRRRRDEEERKGEGEMQMS
jgi:hypothetical protein